MTLSLCMIVKNEENTLPRCLDSVAGCFDEIIIVDTGSTDRTCEIAEKYTSHIYRAEWHDDFSEARNIAFSYANCDYIMWLDADDILTDENREKLLALKATFDGRIDLYYMGYATAYDEAGAPTYYFSRERIVRRATTYQWVGCVHEVLVCDGIRQSTDITVHHKSTKTSYSNRNLMIYRCKIKAGAVLSLRDQYYYARELFYHREYYEAIYILEKYLEQEGDWIENRIDAHLILARCYEELSQTKKALQILVNSFTETPPRAEAVCEIGRLLMAEGKYTDAIGWFRIALDACQMSSGDGFTNADYYEYIPCLQLCVCFDKIKNYREAKKYHDRISLQRPLSAAVQHNQAYFATLEQNGVL